MFNKRLQDSYAVCTLTELHDRCITNFAMRRVNILCSMMTLSNDVIISSDCVSLTILSERSVLLSSFNRIA